MSRFAFLRKADGDFSAYDTMEKVQRAVHSGILAPMHLISPMFGGAEDISNTLFVPPAVLPIKAGIDSILAEALQSGKRVQGFTIKPQYRGASKVSCTILIQAGGDVSIEETIHIW